MWITGNWFRALSPLRLLLHFPSIRLAGNGGWKRSNLTLVFHAALRLHSCAGLPFLAFLQSSGSWNLPTGLSSGSWHPWPSLSTTQFHLGSSSKLAGDSAQQPGHSKWGTCKEVRIGTKERKYSCFYNAFLFPLRSCDVRQRKIRIPACL